MGISVRNIEKSYGRQRVLRKLSFELPPGARLAVFGRNGAGKTTLLRILAGLERPNAGSVAISGFDVRKEADAARRCMGMLSHDSLLYPDLSAMENLELFARLYGVEDPASRARELLDMVGLGKRRLDAARTFSRGMTQRLSLARALVHDPRVLLLDEPYTGLDAQSCRALDGLIAQMNGSHTMVMVDHERKRCLDFCTHVLWLDPLPSGAEEDRPAKPQRAQALFCEREHLSSEEISAILGVSGAGGAQ